jgi:hypothetical protein
MDTSLANTIIDRLGGTSETARICDVKPPSVSEWRKNGIPKAQLRFLKVAHPSVFEGINGEQSRNRRSTDHKEAV